MEHTDCLYGFGRISKFAALMAHTETGLVDSTISLFKTDIRIFLSDFDLLLDFLDFDRVRVLGTVRYERGFP